MLPAKACPIPSLVCNPSAWHDACRSFEKQPVPVHPLLGSVPFAILRKAHQNNITIILIKVITLNRCVRHLRMLGGGYYAEGGGMEDDWSNRCINAVMINCQLYSLSGGAVGCEFVSLLSGMLTIL